jgi:hypothetical protein
MSNHMARTWDHRGSKPLGLKLFTTGAPSRWLTFFLLIYALITHQTVLLLHQFHKPSLSLCFFFLAFSLYLQSLLKQHLICYLNLKWSSDQERTVRNMLLWKSLPIFQQNRTRLHHHVMYEPLAREYETLLSFIGQKPNIADF